MSNIEALQSELNRTKATLLLCRENAEPVKLLITLQEERIKELEKEVKRLTRQRNKIWQLVNKIHGQSKVLIEKITMESP